MADRACGDCEYWKELKLQPETGGGGPDDISGQCRRHAPAVKGLPRWPVTAATEWCGEFKAMRKAAGKKPPTPRT